MSIRDEYLAQQELSYSFNSIDDFSIVKDAWLVIEYEELPRLRDLLLQEQIEALKSTNGFYILALGNIILKQLLNTQTWEEPGRFQASISYNPHSAQWEIDDPGCGCCSDKPYKVADTFEELVTKE